MNTNSAIENKNDTALLDDDLDDLNLDNFDFDDLDLDDLDLDFDSDTDKNDAKSEKVTATETATAKNDTQATQKRSSDLIRYSKAAHDDGLNFSELSIEKQELTCKLYCGWDEMWTLYDTYRAHCDMLFQNVIFDMNEQWTFPESARYIGYIFSCEKSKKKGSMDYIMSILLNPGELRYIKFRPSLNDPMYIAIRKRFNPNPRNPIDLKDCVGNYITLDIENSNTKYGTAFSNLKSARIYSELEMETMFDMFELMLRQTEEN